MRYCTSSMMLRISRSPSPPLLRWRISSSTGSIGVRVGSNPLPRSITSKTISSSSTVTRTVTSCVASLS